MKTYTYTSSNGITYHLVKQYIKFGNAEKRPVYYFKRKESIKKEHFPCDLPQGWEVVENPRNGFPLLGRSFKK